jgi:lipid-binding SYLF domain-containing protein
MMFELFAGADIGVQSYRSILFFKTEKALRNFKKGSFEFTGQANAAHVVGGYSASPSYHPDVAMFVQVKGGILLEASVGTQRYDFFPLPPSAEILD